MLAPMSLLDHWPLFGLTITTPRLTLVLPSDDIIAKTVTLATKGVHDPEYMPFVTPWTDLESPELEQSALKFWWGCRSNFSAEDWNLAFVATLDGEPIGSQSLGAESFPLMRTGATGSWLGLPFQGQGYGKEMRRGVLELAFAHMGADVVTSSAFVDNISSQRVSEAVGYQPNGMTYDKQRDGRTESINYRITRERWNDTRVSDGYRVNGWDRCASMFGL